METNNARNKKDFLSSENKIKAKKQKIMTALGKSLFLMKYGMGYAIYMPPNTKDLAINQAIRN